MQDQDTRQGGEIIPRELLDLYPGLLILLSRDGAIRVVNRLTCQILKKTEDALLRSNFYELCLPAERDRVRLHVGECLDSLRLMSFQTKMLAEDGTPKDIDLSLRVYPSDLSVGWRYCVLIGRDISEEKKKELDLLRFSKIAHFTVNPVEITDPSGRIIYVNPAFEQASGYREEEVLGKNPNIFGSGLQSTAFWKNMWETVRAGSVWVGEVVNRRKTGEPYFSQLLISPIVDADAAIVGYFAVHRDISNQKYLEQQLVHAQKMESIGMLAAGIAHEVGNPLTSISSLVQVIQRTTQDEFTQEKLELIKSQIGRISRIIRDLVDFSRRSSYEIQPTDVNKTLHEAVEIVRVGRKAKQISFFVELDKTIPSLALVPDQIEQVFINILINAVDAISILSPEPGSAGSREGKITVRSAVVGKELTVSIQDNGKGIPRETLPKIFEPFFTTKKVGEGTGLGLWVSYGIIKSFQGEIKVASTEGQGTTFTIILPMNREI